jgi:O-antigen/teichoic acid export membrane protein
MIVVLYSSLGRMNPCRAHGGCSFVERSCPQWIAFQMTADSMPVGTIEVKRTLVRNTLWNYTGFAVNFVSNFIIFPFVVGRVGDSAAGLWLLLGSITGYMGLLELGIVPALTQHVAAALSRGRRDEVDRAASTAMVLLLAMMAVALQALWVVPSLVGALRVPAALRADATAIISISLAGFALRMPLAAFQALLLGCQRQDRCNQLWIVQALAKAAGTFILLTNDLGIVSVVILEAVTPLAAGLLQYRWTRMELPELRIAPRRANLTHARSLLGLGGTLLLGSVCALVIEQTDRLVIGTFLPIAQVTHYSAAWKLYMLLFTVTTTLLGAVAPLAASLHGRQDKQGLRALALAMTKFSAGVAVPLAIGVSLSAGTVLRYWMGPTFIDARIIVIVLSCGFLVTSYNHAGYSVLIGTGRVTRFLWMYSVPQALLNLALSLWLVNPLGNVGVALGSTIPALLLEYPFLRLLMRELDLEWTSFLRGVVWPTAAPALVAFSPLAVAYVLKGHESPILPVVAVGCGLLYASLFWTFSLTPGQRESFWRIIISRGRQESAASAPSQS